MVALLAGCHKEDEVPTANTTITYATGDLDDTFNGDAGMNTQYPGKGVVTTDINSNSMDVANAMTVDSNGKIVVGGYGDAQKFTLVRYNSDGSLDTSFGAGGKVTTDMNPGQTSYIYTIAIQSDGKIVGVKEG